MFFQISAHSYSFHCFTLVFCRCSCLLCSFLASVVWFTFGKCMCSILCDWVQGVDGFTWHAVSTEISSLDIFPLKNLTRGHPPQSQSNVCPDHFQSERSKVSCDFTSVQVQSFALLMFLAVLVWLKLLTLNNYSLPENPCQSHRSMFRVRKCSTPPPVHWTLKCNTPVTF